MIDVNPKILEIINKPITLTNVKFRSYTDPILEDFVLELNTIFLESLEKEKTEKRYIWGIDKGKINHDNND